VSQFLGVPFAQPPLGAKRWKQPELPLPWRATIDATEYKPACAQDGNGPSAEDCLYLDIYTPVDLDDADAAKLAVVLFVHGGGAMKVPPPAPSPRGRCSHQLAIWDTRLISALVADTSRRCAAGFRGGDSSGWPTGIPLTEGGGTFNGCA
jgi:hypothetical protein